MITAPTVAEIRADDLRANLRAIRSRIPAGTRLCPAVKANAYGHGLAPVLRVLTREKAEKVCVANLLEALEVRQLGWTRPVLCLGTPLVAGSEPEQRERAELILQHDLHCTVCTLAEARRLSSLARRWNRVGRIEVKVDTGMGRGGVCMEQAAELIAQVAGLAGIVVEGVYSHLATADEADGSFAQQQVKRLAVLREQLRQQDVAVRSWHTANSAAIFRLPGAHLDCVRPGLALYGYWGGPEGERPAELRPALRVVSSLVAVRVLPAGHAVGYGCTFRTARESTVGLVPIGYADGYRRSLSNESVMILDAVRGQPRRPVPVVGRISMDQTTVDLTGAGDVRVGDPVVVLDNDPDSPNSVESTARRMGTIPYEVTCLLGQRVRRVLLPEAAE